MIKGLPKKSGQAAAELAILGSLVLMILAAIVSYGQRYDHMVEVKMKAFRKALNASYRRNTAVTYTLKEDIRGSDLFSFGRGQPVTAMGSSSVLWQKGMPGTSDETDAEYTVGSYAFYESNGYMLGKREGWDKLNPDDSESMPSLPRVKQWVIPKETPDTTEDEDAKQEVMSPVSIYREEAKRLTNYRADNTRTESGGTAGSPAVRNQDSSILDDVLESKYYSHYDTRGSSKDTAIDYRNNEDELPVYSGATTYSATMRPQVVSTTRPKGQFDSGETISGKEVRYVYCDPNASDYEECMASIVSSKRDWNTK